MQWVKQCPKCGSLQTYATQKILKAAIRDNKLCKLCRPGSIGGGEKNGMFGKKHSDETKSKIAENTRKNMKGKPKPLSQRKRMSLARMGAKHSPETIEKLRKKSMTEEQKEKLRKPKSEKAKQNMRIAARERIRKKLGSLAVPNYNPKACKVIDEFGNKFGYTFQHAMNGGEFHIKELFIWVDGYDKEKNVVIEYDEPHHRWNRYIQKDINRQNEIISYLGCKFIRLIESKDGSIEIKHIN
jgi:hypothetical protein